jgi:hypothetical protein
VGDGTGSAVPAAGAGEAQAGTGRAVALVGTGTGAGVAGQEATGTGSDVGATGSGLAVAVLLGTGLATGAGTLSTVGGATGAADAAPDAALDGAAATGAGVPVARAAGLADALAECDEADNVVPPAADAAPEQPVSASPATRPSTAPLAISGRVFPARLLALPWPSRLAPDKDAPSGARGFSFDRIRMLLHVVSDGDPTRGNTS